MIKFDSRYFNNAYRVSDGKLASTVTTLYDGQWLMRNDSDEFVIHTGTTAKKGYMTISSKYGNPVNNIGTPITQGPNGRDNVTSTGKVSVLVGPYRLATDQYETGTYHAGDPLKISENGKLTPFVVGTDKEYDIVGHVYKAPASASDVLVFVHE